MKFCLVSLITFTSITTNTIKMFIISAIIPITIIAQGVLLLAASTYAAPPLHVPPRMRTAISSSPVAAAVRVRARRVAAEETAALGSGLARSVASPSNLTVLSYSQTAIRFVTPEGQPESFVLPGLSTR